MSSIDSTNCLLDEEFIQKEEAGSLRSTSLSSGFRYGYRELELGKSFEEQTVARSFDQEGIDTVDRVDLWGYPRGARKVFSVDPIDSSPMSVAYKPIERFEGYVEEVRSDSFTARIWETIRSDRQLHVEMSIDEIDESKRELIVDGAPFVWHIGERYIGGGTESTERIWIGKTETVSRGQILEAADEERARLNA